MRFVSCVLLFGWKCEGCSGGMKLAEPERTLLSCNGQIELLTIGMVVRAEVDVYGIEDVMAMESTILKPGECVHPPQLDTTSEPMPSQVRTWATIP